MAVLSRFTTAVKLAALLGALIFAPHVLAQAQAPEVTLHAFYAWVLTQRYPLRGESIARRQSQGAHRRRPPIVSHAMRHSRFICIMTLRFRGIVAHCGLARERCGKDRCPCGLAAL